MIDMAQKNISDTLQARHVEKHIKADIMRLEVLFCCPPINKNKDLFRNVRQKWWLSDQFIRLYGPRETSAMCLIIICAPIAARGARLMSSTLNVDVDDNDDDQDQTGGSSLNSNETQAKRRAEETFLKMNDLKKSSNVIPGNKSPTIPSNNGKSNDKNLG